MHLHPAEIRGYRELYLTGRQLVARWERLANGLEGTGAEDALRGAVRAVDQMLGDLEHVTTLLAYLARVSDDRGHPDLAAFCRSWEQRLASSSDGVRGAAIGLGADPDAAIEPLDSSAVGRAAHRTAWAVGTVGEWIDRRAAS